MVFLLLLLLSPKQHLTSFKNPPNIEGFKTSKNYLVFVFVF
jgi:hypothetical protein